MAGHDVGVACANGCRIRGTAVPLRCRPPLVVCKNCQRRAEEALANIGRRWAQLPRYVARGSLPSEDELPEIRGRAAEAPVPIRPEVVSLTDVRGTLSIPAFLHAWADYCRAEHNARRHPELDVMKDLVSLTMYLDWALSESPAVAKRLCAALSRAASLLADAVGEKRPRPVGVCFAILEEATEEKEAVTCGGPLLPQTYDFGVYCPRCGDTWGREDLRGLGVVLGEAREAERDERMGGAEDRGSDRSEAGDDDPSVGLSG